MPMPIALPVTAPGRQQLNVADRYRRERACRRSAAVAGLLGLIGVLVSQSPALADLKLCNYTASRVGVAVGYKDQDGWVTEGWWNVLSNSCETMFTGELKARFYYVHAVDYDRGGEWAGKDLMCVGDKAFTIKGVDSCSERGYKRTGFYEVDTGEAKEFTIRLTDPGDSGAKTQ
jgi:uncharacterized membrane protein